ncbi:anti-sigma B factor RsbW [Natribacillus halophilus]|uniref:Serine/threonine-protein kinase RsbW n=1 Tax=Natribacillus halophilus TaxID=549003 RepID=A0A1G8QJS1_9BACI|nr:anti-sigma B factor RsbW [Natribacillus halophilus]SDJ04898.1 serine/threonine-protein kinase RsbW [Natribacillus halophilus]
MTAHQDLIEMKVPAKPEYVGIVRLTVSGVANRVGYTYDEIEDIKVAIAEACTNVVDHAYHDEGLISLEVSVREQFVEFRITDYGRDANAGELKKYRGPIQPDEPIQELTEGGLGLFLIESLMDDVEIKQNKGVAIVMKKFFLKDGVTHGTDGFETKTTNENR